MFGGCTAAWARACLPSPSSGRCIFRSIKRARRSWASLITMARSQGGLAHHDSCRHSYFLLHPWIPGSTDLELLPRRTVTESGLLLQNMASAVAAGAVSDVVTNPLWVVRLRLQVWPTSRPHNASPSLPLSAGGCPPGLAAFSLARRPPSARLRIRPFIHSCSRSHADVSARARLSVEGAAYVPLQSVSRCCIACRHCT